MRLEPGMASGIAPLSWPKDLRETLKRQGRTSDTRRFPNEGGILSIILSRSRPSRTRRTMGGGANLDSVAKTSWSAGNRLRLLGLRWSIEVHGGLLLGGLDVIAR